MARQAEAERERRAKVINRPRGEVSGLPKRLKDAAVVIEAAIRSRLQLR